MFNIIKKLKRDNESLQDELKKGHLHLRGELEVIGMKDGKVIHYDKNHNTITVWAKHSTMHVLSGESFSSFGALRSTSSSDHIETSGAGINNDGTLISGRQYFAAPTFPGTDGWWSRPIQGDSVTHLYPHFPTKMLFGTGFEWKSWSDIDSTYQSSYSADGWSTTNFDASGTIDNAANNYSNTYESTTHVLEKTRSMNDIYSDALSKTINETDFAISGAIKNALYNSETGDSTNLELVDGNYFPKKDYWGIGSPAFIYARRESRFYQTGAEVALNWDTNVENKITFTITMPEQTGTNAGIYYPYNGFVLKEAGLFCDARFILHNTAPSDEASSDDTALDEYDNYLKMPHGIMFARRLISPITKSHNISITVRWSIYL